MVDCTAVTIPWPGQRIQEGTIEIDLFLIHGLDGSKKMDTLITESP